MHILIATHGFPPTHSAGAERRAERMARWLTENGQQVTVFAIEHLNQPGFKDEVSTQDGFIVHRLSFDIGAGDYFHNMYDNPRLGQAFRDVLKTQTFDVLHVVSGYMLGGQIINAAKEAGLPTVLTLTEFWFMCIRLNLLRVTNEVCSGPERHEKCMRCVLEEKRRYRVLARIMPQITNALWKLGEHLLYHKQMTQKVQERQQTLHQALDRVDCVICPSQFLLTKFTEFGFDTSRYIFMRQGIDKPGNVKPHIKSAQNGSLRLVYMGQVDRHKGIDVLIEAVIGLLNQGKKIELDIWGADNGTPSYSAMVKQRSEPYSAIHWRGRFVGDKVWGILANADAMVMPSRWYENSPNIILESFEMDVPVIATRLGGMAELVEHDKNGLLFELNNMEDLQCQIIRLIDEPDLLGKLEDGAPYVRSVGEDVSAE